MLHREAVEPGLFNLAQRLSAEPALEPFYLVGGTSLALQIGHRFSIDIDLFTHEDFDFETVAETVGSFDAASIQVSREGTVVAEIEGIKIDIIRHRYPLIGEVTEADGLRLLGLPDIAAMKLLAISSRGSKKDFFDVAALLDTYELPQLLDFFGGKYPKMEIFQAVMSLTYFEDAEPEPAPRVLNQVTWAQVKNRIRKAVASL